MADAPTQIDIIETAAVVMENATEGVDDYYQGSLWCDFGGSLIDAETWDALMLCAGTGLVWFLLYFATRCGLGVAYGRLSLGIVVKLAFARIGVGIVATVLAVFGATGAWWYVAALGWLPVSALFLVGNSRVYGRMSPIDALWLLVQAHLVVATPHFMTESVVAPLIYSMAWTARAADAAVGKDKGMHKYPPAVFPMKSIYSTAQFLDAIAALSLAAVWATSGDSFAIATAVAVLAVTCALIYEERFSTVTLLFGPAFERLVNKACRREPSPPGRMARRVRPPSRR